MLLKLYKKDLKVLLSDKKALMIFILMPMVLTTILSFALNGTFGEIGNMDAIPVGVVSLYDKSAENKAFLETATQYMGDNAKQLEVGIDTALDFEAIFFDTFLGNSEIKSILNIKQMSESDAMAALEDGEIKAAIVLPKGFIYDQLVNFTLPNRNNVDVTVIHHPDATYSGSIVESIVGSYFDSINKQIVNKNTFLEVGSSYLDRDQLFKEMSTVLTQETTDKHSVINRMTIPGKRLIDSFTYYSIGMMGMFILYSAGYMGRELLREKKMLTLDRGVVAGVHYGKVLISKFLMTVTLCFIQMSVLILYATLVLGVAWNNPIKIAVGIFFSAIAVSGMGIFISAITLTVENYRVANIFENLLIHLFALIGGSYIPLDALPKIFLSIKYFALNGIVLDLFINTYQDEGWQRLSFYYGFLIAITAVFAFLAAVIIKRKETVSYEGNVEA
ncbi:ABC transporter permease [Fusibacter bizertensis]